MSSSCSLLQKAKKRSWMTQEINLIEQNLVMYWLMCSMRIISQYFTIENFVPLKSFHFFALCHESILLCAWNFIYSHGALTIQLKKSCCGFETFENATKKMFHFKRNSKIIFCTSKKVFEFFFILWILLLFLNQLGLNALKLSFAAIVWKSLTFLFQI